MRKTKQEKRLNMLPLSSMAVPSFLFVSLWLKIETWRNFNIFNKGNFR